VKKIMVFDSVKQILKQSFLNTPESDGPAGSVLGTDGNGNLSWIAPASSITSTFYDVSTPQTTFQYSDSLETKNFSVYVNGILQRRDSLADQFDYYVSGTYLIFRYTVPAYASVRLDIHNIGSSSEYGFDFTSTEGQTTFSADRLLAGKMVQVYRNGLYQRINDGNDYTISESSVVFNYGLPVNSWVHILVRE
jgi:hypothetical protein